LDDAGGQNMARCGRHSGVVRSDGARRLDAVNLRQRQRGALAKSVTPDAGSAGSAFLSL